MPALTLDNVIFEKFELPEEIPLGGKHAGKLHKLPGGVRIFDAKGPDDENISWHGRFRSNSALPRAISLDSMRRAGGERTLTILGLSYTVVIESFTYTIRKPYEVDYSISMIVLSDNTQGLDVIGATPGDTNTLVWSDLKIASDALSGEDAATDVAMAALQAALVASGNINNLPLSSLTGVNMAASTLGVAMDGAIVATDATIIEDPLADDPFNSGADNIAALGESLDKQSALLNGAGYAGRAVANIDNDAG